MRKDSVSDKTLVNGVVTAQGDACLKCRGPLDARHRCWKCCDRRCSRCGKATGSAFIELCLSCQAAEEREAATIYPND